MFVLIFLTNNHKTVFTCVQGLLPKGILTFYAGNIFNFCCYLRLFAVQVKTQKNKFVLYYIVVVITSLL